MEHRIGDLKLDEPELRLEPISEIEKGVASHTHGIDVLLERVGFPTRCGIHFVLTDRLANVVEDAIGM